MDAEDPPQHRYLRWRGQLLKISTKRDDRSLAARRVSFDGVMSQLLLPGAWADGGGMIASAEMTSEFILE